MVPGYSDESMIHRIEDHVEDLEKDVGMLSKSHMSHESAEGLEQVNVNVSPEYHNNFGGDSMMYPYSPCGVAGGGLGAGIVGGIIGGQLFRHGGYGYGDSCGGDGSRGGSTLSYLKGRDSGLEAKTSDVVSATAALTSGMVAGFESTSNTVRNTGAVTLGAISDLSKEVGAFGIATMQGFNQTQRDICESRHAADLQFAMLAKEAALQHCAIEKAISCEAEKTRAMLIDQNNQRYEDKLEATRFRLNEVERQRDLLATGNFPVTQHVNVEKCHGRSSHDDIAIQFNNVNQQIAAIGSTVSQMGGALQGLLQK